MKKQVEIIKHTITIKGQKIKYRTAGSGEPIFFIHGLSGSLHWWKYNIPELADNYKIYLIDLPGFGNMRSILRKISLNEIDDWVIKFMDALEIKKAHFIGHSMGGYVCTQIAANYPEKVKRLVLVSSVGVDTNRSIISSVLPLLNAFRYVTPDFLPVLMIDALKAGPLTLFLFAQEVLTANTEEALPKIEAPTLLIWGTQDTLIPVEYAEVFKKEIKHSSLIKLRGVGHVPMFDRPKEFNELVTKFLSYDKINGAVKTM
jgi:pimeloyl-ACP methyl ester carboxylesterase